MEVIKSNSRCWIRKIVEFDQRNTIFGNNDKKKTSSGGRIKEEFSQLILIRFRQSPFRYSVWYFILLPSSALSVCFFSCIFILNSPCSPLSPCGQFPRCYSLLSSRVYFLHLLTWFIFLAQYQFLTFSLISLWLLLIPQLIFWPFCNLFAFHIILFSELSLSA